MRTLYRHTDRVNAPATRSLREGHACCGLLLLRRQESDTLKPVPDSDTSAV